MEDIVREPIELLEKHLDEVAGGFGSVTANNASRSNVLSNNVQDMSGDNTTTNNNHYPPVTYA